MSARRAWDDLKASANTARKDWETQVAKLEALIADVARQARQAVEPALPYDLDAPVLPDGVIAFEIIPHDSSDETRDGRAVYCVDCDTTIPTQHRDEQDAPDVAHFDDRHVVTWRAVAAV